MDKGGSTKRSASPTDSLISGRSDQSKEYPPEFSTEPRPPEQSGLTEDLNMDKGGSTKRSASPTDSLISGRSDQSKEYPPEFSTEPRPPEQSRLTEDLNMDKPESKKRSASPTDSLISASIQQNQDTMKVFESKAIALLKKTLRTHKRVLSESEQGEDEQEEALDQMVLSDRETNEAALKIALHVLKTMDKDERARTLEQSHHGELLLYQQKQKAFLVEKTKYLQQEIAAQKSPVPLKKIYTTLYLIEGNSENVNSEHEVRQIEKAFNRTRASENLISCEDIFKPLPKQDHSDQPVRMVLTQGIAGIGKTVLAQKFILDWAEEKANQDIQLLFSISFRELNLLRKEKRSLMELLCDFSPDLNTSGIKDLEKHKVLVLLDGLDESRLQLDFKENVKCSDATQSVSVDVLLTNLIAGNLLPEAKVWITTRPAAASCISPQYVDRVTEIRGFNNLQKEEYFHKKIEDEKLAKRVIANIKSTRSLHIMCHVPVFCWISSIVLGERCARAPAGKMPKTLTQMYIHFVAHQTSQMYDKYSKEKLLDSKGNNKVIMSLGKLAFQQLEKGNLIFYEEDLTECGIDVKEASVYSGVVTQIVREESCMQHKVFCFVHLSVQEFLAALYVHVMYKVDGVNLMMEETEEMSKTKPVSELHKAAVGRALRSDSGHLDLFLRFLLGLSQKSNQDLLRGLKIQVKTCDSQSHDETIKYIKEKIGQTDQTERYINLFHCLNELNDHYLLDEIQRDLDSDRISVMDDCSAAHWAALVFMLLSSPERPEEIHLKKYSRTEEGLVKILPAIKASRSAMLNDCNLTAESCHHLASSLSSRSNQLIHLNLSDNSLQDSGIKNLCAGLQSPYCRLKTLRLNRCRLTQGCCETLASALSCSSSGLRELDLSDNDIEDSGVELLCTGLKNKCCKLEVLRLSFCSITEKGCGFLASAVKSNPSHLTDIDLSYNHLGESGVRFMVEALNEPQCEFTKLRVDHNAEHWFKPGLRKYACELTVDPNTVHKLLVLSEENKKITWGEQEQPYPDHPDRFHYRTQALFQQGLTGRCYWEMEWEGIWAGVGVTYKGINRKGQGSDSFIGYNEKSWSLHCSGRSFRAYHDFKAFVPPVPLGGCRGLAVYLDWEAGILSFYRVSPAGSLTHLHTFNSKFTEPLYPVIRVWDKGSSVRLCQAK